MAALKPYELNALPSYGPNRGPLRNNYNRFKRFFADELERAIRRVELRHANAP